VCDCAQTGSPIATATGYDRGDVRVGRGAPRWGALLAGLAGVCLSALPARAQPFNLGQTAQTRVNWAGFSAPGVLPSRVLSHSSPDGVAMLSPPAYGFSSIINGGLMTYTSGQWSMVRPLSDTEPVLARAGAFSSLTNATVAGAAFSSSAAGIFAESIGVTEIVGSSVSQVHLTLTFVLSGRMQRSDALGRAFARMNVNLAPLGGSPFTTLYSDVLGGSRTYLGAPLPANDPGELERTISGLEIPVTFTLQVGGAPTSFALVLNAITTYSVGTSTGHSGSSLADFHSGDFGLRLDRIHLTEPGGAEIPSHVVRLSAGTGTDYSRLVIPSPGAPALLVATGILAIHRRRRH
jgi:hypothetical protein